jgi:DNA-binding MarR family transcriptional regulator
MLFPVAKRSTPLQRELRQTRPFQSPSHEAVVGLIRTADLMRRILAGVLEPHGMTLQQYNVLRILRGAGDAGLPTLEVAERMIEQTPGVTRLLDRLEAKGHIRRERCRRDRRQHLCWLTKQGAHLLERLEAPVMTAQDEALKALGEAECRQLVKLLARVRGSRRIAADDALKNRDRSAL